jgi:two-component system, OmpR family, sensor histidine kinase TctE
MIELPQAFFAWPLAITMAAVVAAQGLRAGRRRSSLNEALHELRRPLQTIALSGGREGISPPVLESSVQMAAAALERLEREVNGGVALRLPAEPIELRALLDSAARRWRSRVNLGGGSLRLRWRAGEAFICGRRVELAQALDNLIVNAIEHGGPRISIDVRPYKSRVRIVIADSGRASRPPARRGTPAETIARLSGRRRRGHGLVVVRRVAAAHGGRFALRHSERGSLAMLELPLHREREGLAA